MGHHLHSFLRQGLTAASVPLLGTFFSACGMPKTPGFECCQTCRRSFPLSEGHSNCCLGEAHIPLKCKVCSGFKSRFRKLREDRLKLLLIKHPTCPLPYIGLRGAKRPVELHGSGSDDQVSGDSFRTSEEEAQEEEAQVP